MSRAQRADKQLDLVARLKKGESFKTSAKLSDYFDAGLYFQSLSSKHSHRAPVFDSGETDGRHLCLSKLRVGALLLVVQPHMTN